jgi:hypothetical protein
MTLFLNQLFELLNGVLLIHHLKQIKDIKIVKEMYILV